MNDLDSHVNACMYAPDDESPRHVLADWLDDQGEDYAERSHAWKWYWLELIPALRADLDTDDETAAVRIEMYKRHVQNNDTYMLRLAYRQLLPGAAVVWATAVCRTFVDQGGGRLFGAMSPEKQEYVAAVELGCLFPTVEPVVYHNPGNKLLQYNAPPFRTLGINEPLPNRRFDADRCAYHMPNSNESVDRFVISLSRFLFTLDEREAHGLFDGEIEEIYPTDFLLGYWLPRSIHVTRSRHKKAFPDQYPIPPAKTYGSPP